MTKEEELVDSHDNQSSFSGVILQNLIETDLTERLNHTEKVYNISRGGQRKNSF